MSFAALRQELALSFQVGCTKLGEVLEVDPYLWTSGVLLNYDDFPGSCSAEVSWKKHSCQCYSL